MACLQIYQKLLLLVTFPRVHSNSKEVSYLPWQNTYPNLKTTCNIKLKIFLRTKLIENLLLTKYLISVTTPLICSFDGQQVFRPTSHRYLGYAVIMKINIVFHFTETFTMQISPYICLLHSYVTKLPRKSPSQKNMHSLKNFLSQKFQWSLTCFTTPKYLGYLWIYCILYARCMLMLIIVLTLAMSILDLVVFT